MTVKIYALSRAKGSANVTQTLSEEIKVMTVITQRWTWCFSG